MKTCYSYCRFSSKRQELGDSVRRQTERARNWANDNGYTVSTLTFRDLGISAFRGKHRHTGALSAFLQGIKNRKIKPGELLIIECLDRLSREEVWDALEPFRQIINAGVDIVALMPYERRYTQKMMRGEQGIFLLQEAMWGFYTANIESQKKSDRSRSNWEAKHRQALEGKPTTAHCPSWLKLNNGKFTTIPERVKTLKLIFKMASEGYGIRQIVRALNEKQTPTWGRSKGWTFSTITTLLKMRHVLGEYQPKENGKPVGTIPNYFPRVIPEPLFYKVQKAVADRTNQRGRTGKEVANLFTALIFDAHDNSPMHLVKGQNKTRLVSYGAMRGKKGSKFTSFPYKRFEEGLLWHISEISSAELMPKKAVDEEGTLAVKEGELAKVEVRMKELTKLRMTENLSALVDMMRELERDKVRLTKEIDKLRQRLATPESRQLTETKSLVAALAAASDQYSVRANLRGKIRGMIEKIVVKVVVLGRFNRVADCHVHYRSGLVKHIKINSIPVKGVRVQIIATHKQPEILAAIDELMTRPLKKKLMRRK